MWDWMDGVGDTPQTVTTIGADEEDEEAAIHISLDGYDAMGIGYMALWGFRAKCWSGVEWMDTPQTITTTRAPAVLKTAVFLSDGFPYQEATLVTFSTISLIVLKLFQFFHKIFPISSPFVHFQQGQFVFRGLTNVKLEPNRKEE